MSQSADPLVNEYRVTRSTPSFGDALLILAFVMLGFGWWYCTHLLERIETQNGITSIAREVDGEQQTVLINVVKITMPSGRVYQPPYDGLWLAPTYLFRNLLVLSSIVFLIFAIPRTIAIVFRLDLLTIVIWIFVIAVLIALFLPALQAAREY